MLPEDVDPLAAEIEAFERLRPTLEPSCSGQWVVFHDGRHVGTYGSFEDAADASVRQFGHGPYLIREVGSSQATSLPASLWEEPNGS